MTPRLVWCFEQWMESKKLKHKPNHQQGTLIDLQARLKIKLIQRDMTTKLAEDGHGKVRQKKLI